MTIDNSKERNTVVMETHVKLRGIAAIQLEATVAGLEEATKELWDQRRISTEELGEHLAWLNAVRKLLGLAVHGKARCEVEVDG